MQRRIVPAGELLRGRDELRVSVGQLHDELAESQPFEGRGFERARRLDAQHDFHLRGERRERMRPPFVQRSASDDDEPAARRGRRRDRFELFGRRLVITAHGHDRCLVALLVGMCDAEDQRAAVQGRGLDGGAALRA
ncbi:MAG: hypothetical protein KAI24_20990, partial [Planctomycetes bacterium]|nr:hypothetical protein [Planctomycetota bacterium]